MRTFLMLVQLTRKSKRMGEPSVTRTGLYLVEAEKDDVNTIFLTGHFMLPPANPEVLGKMLGNQSKFEFFGIEYDGCAEKVDLSHQYVRDAVSFFKLKRPEDLFRCDLSVYLHEEELNNVSQRDSMTMYYPKAQRGLDAEAKW